ncbi:MAG: SRPBCC domain-containing protein [Flavobacteriales bacterium]|nr:SRPBCC domain-containing protein [Flavobacteriales bacterium]
MDNQKEKNSYNQELIIRANIKDSFSALTQKIDLWWGEVDQPIAKVGDEFSVSFANANWSFRVTEFVPNSKLTWECIGGNPEFNTEWIGDLLYWNMEEVEGDKVKISLLQVGLTPEMNCFEICNKGWNFFITKSLKSYLETGVGNLNFVEPE